MRHLLSIEVLFLLTFVVQPSHAGSLIKNGSFEKPVVPDGSYETFGVGDSFKNWTVVGEPGNIAIVNEDFTYCAHTFPARKGAQFVDLTGTSDTSGTGLQQIIDTVPGSTYQLSFYIGNVYDIASNCGTTSTVNVEIDGQEVASFTNKGKNDAQIVWKKFTTDFVAQNATTAVSLTNADPPGDTANGLDAVSVTLVAAP
jgi:hypothetical protein